MSSLDTGDTVAADTRVILRATGIRKRYGGLQALSGADVSIRQGEVHGIIGPNGAGKSTLVKILAGVEQPDDGVIELDGVAVSYQGPHNAQKLGVILMPQELTLLPGSSLSDNIVLGAEPQRFGVYKRRTATDRAARALESVGLNFDPHSMATHLSTAHRRLLTLARAMDRSARILILDEPTAGLPPKEAEIIKDTVRRLKTQGVTILYISHHLSELVELCDRVTCLRSGRVLATLGGNKNGVREVSKEALVALILGRDRPDDVNDRSADMAPRNANSSATPGMNEPPADEAGNVRQNLAASVSDGCVIEGKDLRGARLEGVSFRAYKHEVTGITGLLGSGVTELIGMVAGSLRPDSGQILIDGSPVSLLSPADALKHGVGYLAGDRTTAAFPAMSVRENVTISALQRWFGVLGLVSRDREARETEAVLKALSVTVDPEQRISNLSGGNQQRALVGRLLASASQCLILDDPTVGVDIAARATLWAAVRELSRGRTIVVASSEAEELVALCDRVVCLRHGGVSQVLEGDGVTVEAITHAVS
ncbi:sugar ABC transporter ATP-binding protein [Paraburkholderia strydomiana]|uniref:sugar ABC transporter ATP-binding protein n=1 Tax=Paraburkholderia strydomiana TaxID=1245417 RepID=UPI0038B9F598